MDKIIHQLGELLLSALPTFLLVLFLNYYLKFVFFQPLEKALKQRYDATDGARKLAEESMQRADAKTAEYEATLRAALISIAAYEARVPRTVQYVAEANHVDTVGAMRPAQGHWRRIESGQVA